MIGLPVQSKLLLCVVLAPNKPSQQRDLFFSYLLFFLIKIINVFLVGISSCVGDDQHKHQYNTQRVYLIIILLIWFAAFHSQWKHNLCYIKRWIR